MSIKIDYTELLEVLKFTPASHNIMLVGKHGIGKSQILFEYFQQKDQRVIPFFLGQMSDPGDLIGLLNKNPITGHSEFLPPYWWPLDNKPIVLFLDELNRARPELLQTIQDLALNRTLAGKKLPEGSRIIAAINAGDEYQLTDLDPALLSRFNIYEFVPTVDDWISWAYKSKIDPRVIQFIQKNNSFLDPVSVDTGDGVIEKMPDRRSWARVSDIIQPIESITNMVTKIISGVVGVSASLSFKKFVDTTLLVSPEDILFHFNKSVQEKLDSLPLQEMIFLNNQLLHWLNNNVKNWEASLRNKSLTNLEKYFKYMTTSKRREAIADIFNQLQKKDMDYTRDFIINSTEIFKLFEKYTESIEL